MEAAHSSLLFPFSFTSVIANDREKDDGVREETKLNDQQQRQKGRGNHQRGEMEARHRDSHGDDDDASPDFSPSSPLSLLPLPSREEWDRLAQTRLCIRVKEENTKRTRRKGREMESDEEEDEEKEGREIGKSNLKDTTTRGAEEHEESHHHRHRQQSNHQFHDYFLSVKDVKVVCHLLGIKPKVATEVAISLVRELLKRTANGQGAQSNVEEEKEGAEKKEDGEEQDAREETTTTAEEELFSSPTSPSSANIVDIPYHLFAVVAFEVLSVNSRAPFDLQSLQPYWDEENKEDGNDREIFNDENNGQHTKSRRNGPPLPFPQSHPHPYPSSSPFFTSTPPATPSSPPSTAAASPPALPSSPFKLGTALHPPQPSPQSQPQSPPPPQPLHHPAAQQQQQQTSTSSASFATFFRLLHTLLAIVTHRSALIVLCGGTSGTGKTTLASLLAARFGIRRIVSTDSLREALRFVVRRRGEDEDVGGEEEEKDDKEPDGEKRDNRGDTKEKEEDLRSDHDKDAGAEMKRDGDEKRDDKLVAAVGQHQLRFGELFVSTYEAYKCDASQACLAKITAATTKTNTNARTKTRSTVTTLTTTQGVAMEKGKRKNEGKRDDGEEERGSSLPSHPSPCAIGGDATAPTATAKGNTNDNAEDNGNDIVSSSVLGHHIQASLVMPSVLAFIRRALLSPSSSSSPTPRHRRGVKANRNKKRNGSSIRVGGDGDDDHLRTTMNTAVEYDDDDDDDDDEGNNHRSSSKSCSSCSCSCSCSCSSSALFESRSAIIEGVHLTVEAVQQIAYEVNVRPYLKKKKKKIVVRGNDNGRREREREIGNRMGEEKEEEETNLSASSTTTKEGTDEGGNASSSSPLPRPPRVIVVPTLIHIEKEEAHKQRFAARSSSSSLTNTVKKDNNDKDEGDSSSTRPTTTCLDTANDAVAADKENEEDAERKDRSGDGGREGDGGGKVVNDACPAGVSPTTPSSLFDPTNEPDAVVTTMMRSIDVSNNFYSSSSSISVSQKRKKADDRITNINTMMMKPTTMKNRKGREGEENTPTEEVETPASATSELAITTARETAVPVVVVAAAVVGLSLSPTHNKYVAQLPSIRAIQEHGLVKPSIAFQEAFLLKVMLMQQRHGTQKEDEDEGKTHANTSPTSSDDVIGDCSGSFFPILRVLNTNVDRSLMRIHCHMLKVVEIVGIFKQHQRDHDEEEKSSSSPSSSPVCLFSSVVAKLTRDCLADVYKKRRKEAREKKEEREEDREDGNEVFVRKRVKIKQEERRGKKSYEKKKSVTFSSSVFAFAPPAALTSSVAGDLVIDNGGAKNVIIKKKDKEEEEAEEEGFATTTTTDACSVDEDEEDDHGEGGAYSSGIDRPPLLTVCTSSNAISSRLHPSTRHRFINDATTTATSAFMLDTTATTAPVRGYDSYNNSKKESNKEVAASSSSSSTNNSSEEEEEERGEGRGATEDVGWFNQHNLREGENEGSGEEEEEEQRGRGRRTRLDTAFFSPSLSAKDTLSLIHSKHAAKKRRWGRKQK